jgi:hypothetical protein
VPPASPSPSPARMICTASYTPAPTRPRATGTTEFDDIGDAALEVRQQRGRCHRPKPTIKTTPTDRHECTTSIPSPNSPNLGAQRRTRIEVSSPAPRTLPSAGDPRSRRPRPLNGPHNLLAPPPTPRVAPTTAHMSRSKGRFRPKADLGETQSKPIRPASTCVHLRRASM